MLTREDVRRLALEAKGVLTRAPHRTPAQPWPPTDPFVYRLCELVLRYGPVFKDVAHEPFGDGITSWRWTSERWIIRPACHAWS